MTVPRRSMKIILGEIIFSSSSFLFRQFYKPCHAFYPFFQVCEAACLLSYSLFQSF